MVVMQRKQVNRRKGLLEMEMEMEMDQKEKDEESEGERPNRKQSFNGDLG